MSNAVIPLLELAKLLLSGYFQAVKLANKTDEEIDQIYQDEKAKFEQNKPSNLPDV